MGGDFEQPIDENLHASAVEIDTKFALIKRMGDGIAVSFQLRYEQALNHGVQEEGESNVFDVRSHHRVCEGTTFADIESAVHKQVGTFADQEGLGFNSGWRAEYDLNRRWGIEVEMFGQIEDLANAGSFNDQVHSIGPTLFLNFGGEDNEAKGGEDEVKAKASGDNDKGNWWTCADVALNERRCSIWADRCHVRHRVKVPGLTRFLSHCRGT